MTQVLGDVELLTKQEIGAMIANEVISEATIDSKVRAETEEREAADVAIRALISVEQAEREAADIAIRADLATETTNRELGDETLKSLLDQEVLDRKAADAAIVTRVEAVESTVSQLNNLETESLSNLRCSRLTNFPLAVIQVDNDDKSVQVDHTMATVSARYRPMIPVDFTIISEQLDELGAPSTWLLMLRLDTAGNIKCVNKLQLYGASAATDTTTVSYLTAN